MRTVKSRLARLNSRVETVSHPPQQHLQPEPVNRWVGRHTDKCRQRAQVRELLERLLDDDSDMRNMNLTAKCAWLA